MIQLLFCGEEVEVGSETLADKKQFGGWAGGRDRQMDLFFTILSLPFLHFPPKKYEITIMA